MNRSRRMSRIVFTCLFIAGFLGACATSSPRAPGRTHNAELAYLQTIHEGGAVGTPALTLMLMSEFLSARRTEAGVAFFETLVAQPQLAAEQQALYRACLGAVRAAHAEKVPLLRRISWVKESIALLDSARAAGGDNVAIRWLTGTVLAQLPTRFAQTEAAMADLNWVLERADQLPEAGMLRPLYLQLARLHQREDNGTEARRFLALSGYESDEPAVNLSTSFAVNAETGHTFYPRRLQQVIPGKIFALSGYEFTEYYFVVTEDGKELVSIDAGTRPDAAQLAYESLMAQFPGLPPLTTVFVTHAHWDHIGGYKYFRNLNPKMAFISRANYQHELDLMVQAPPFFQWFFGTRYTNENLKNYQPTQVVDEKTALSIGGTTFELIPIEGGETADGLFIHLPQHSTTFVGDFIMPFIGAPFVPEGNPEGLLDAIDILAELDSTHVLHGHETLTRRFNPPAMLTKLKQALGWLKAEVYRAHISGLGRADIHQRNLVAPVVLEQPEVQFTYLILRENFINRVYHRMTGYWKHDLDGMDYLSNADFGVLLSGYLGLSEEQIVATLQEMMQHGDYALAARMAGWGLASHPGSADLEQLRRRAYVKLKEKYQFINPFKLIIYSEYGDHPTPQLALPK